MKGGQYSGVDKIEICGMFVEVVWDYFDEPDVDMCGYGIVHATDLDTKKPVKESHYEDIYDALEEMYG